MNSKTYVIDTNVLVHDYNAFDNILVNNVVIVPYTVLEELDRLKVKTDSVGVNARHTIKRIEEEYIANNQGLIIAECDDSIPVPDDRILEACIKYTPHHPILVSKDVCLRTKARAKGVTVEDYKADKVSVDNLYTGLSELFVGESVVNECYQKGSIKVLETFHPNEAVILINESNTKIKCLTTYRDGVLTSIDNKLTPFGLACANVEQQVATNLLLDPDIKLVTMTGGSGSGKTLLAVACALEAVLEREDYKKIAVARPIMPFQKDIGYIPGSVEEKLNPWLAPIVDSLDYLFSMSNDQPKSKRGGRLTPFEELQTAGVLESCALTFIRGRSIPHQFIIIDEAQQITKEELKTILTRAGKGTKVILTGDYGQIDNPYLSADTNGLVYCVDKFKNEEIAGHISFTKCERSELADTADRIM